MFLFSCSSNRHVIPNPRVSKYMKTWSEKNKTADEKYVSDFSAYLNSVEQFYWNNDLYGQFEDYLKTQDQESDREKILLEQLGDQNFSKLKGHHDNYVMTNKVESPLPL